MINIKDLHIRDPFILKYNGGYVLSGTSLSNGFCAYYSDDLQEFSAPYEIFVGGDSKFARNNYWAPEIYEYNGKFYMFATVKPHDGPRYCISFISDSPLKRFTPLGRITPEGWGCLDATLYVEDGVPYAVFCHEWLQVYDGEICAVRLKDDLSAYIGEPFLLFKASDAPWVGEISCKEFGKDYSGLVTDGPYLFRDGGQLKILWSSFSKSCKYAQSICVSESGKISGPWIQEKQPYFPFNGGHGMIFEKSGKKILALHEPNDSPLERIKFITIN